MDRSPAKQQSMPRMTPQRQSRNPRAQMSHTLGRPPVEGSPGRQEGAELGRPALHGAALTQLMAQRKASRQLNKIIGGSSVYGKKRHKTPLQNAGQIGAQRGGFGTAGNFGGTAASNNQDLYDQVHQPRFTKQQVQEQLMPVQRETGSRLFGDKLEDYQELATRLGDFKLSRLRANELNIYARGSVAGVQAHLNLLRQSNNAFGQEANTDLSLIDCLTGQANQVHAGPGAGEGEGGQPVVPRRPQLDVQRVADWFNQNAHLIRSKNYLMRSTNEFQGAQFFGRRAVNAPSAYTDTQFASQSGLGGGRNAGGEGRWASQLQTYGAAQDQSGRKPDFYPPQPVAGRAGAQRYADESLSHLQEQTQQLNQSSYMQLPQDGALSQTQHRYSQQAGRYDRLQPAILEQMDLENNIHKTLNIMKKDKKVLSQVQSTLSLYQQDRIKKSFEDGLRATSLAQKRVREHRQRRSEEEEAGIEDLIKQQTDAIHATNLERLLTKKWSEHPNSYHIMTRIAKFSKKEDRVNKLLNLNRYSP